MPIYHFELEDGTRLTDPTGLHCMDDTDAKTNADFIVRQVAYDAPSESAPRAVVVVSDAGKEIYRVTTDPAHRHCSC